MNNLLWIVVGVLIVGGGFAYAQSKIEKTNNGFVIRDNKIHTYYENKIIWGDNYVDHNSSAPVHNTEVVAFGEGWEYSTTTNDNGEFKVEVKPDVPFWIKASDGNLWAISEELEGVQEGTTGS